MSDTGAGALSEPSTEHGRWLWLWFKGHGHDGLAFLRAILSIEAEARPEPIEGDAGACPTCHSTRCVGRLQYENCDTAEAQPYVGPDVNILGIKESPGKGDIRC